MYVRNWKTANKKALRINGTPLFLQETVYTFSSICQILFQIFFGISECAKCSAFVFQCVHILFMIHSKNFHSLIMPNSFFPFILPNVSEMSQNIFRYMLYTLFSQYFILILFEYTFFIIARQPSVWHPPFSGLFFFQLFTYTGKSSPTKFKSNARETWCVILVSES